MSDLNDDLLNYELGEELDDPTSLAGDEDELLLSDEEQKAILKDEAEKWVSSKLKAKKPINRNDTKKTEDVVTTSSFCNESSPERNDVIRDTNIQVDSDVSTSEELPHKNSQLEEKKPQESLKCDLQSKNDEVTSTNKEIEDQSVSQTVDKREQNILKEDLQGSSNVAKESEVLCDLREDLEEKSERTNIKHANERDEHSNSSENYRSGRNFASKRPRGGLLARGGRFPVSKGPVKYPHLHYPQYASHPNENVNLQSQYSFQPLDSQLGPRHPFPLPNQMPPRMDFQMPMASNFRSQNPSEFMHRGPRPEYISQINGVPYYSLPVPVRPVFTQDSNVPTVPQGHIRHRMSIHPGPPGISPQGQNQPFMVAGSQPRPIPNTGHPSAFTIIASVSNAAPSVIPRKVLINPNFKGGVEAATNQLIKDTQFMQTISSHAAHLQSDEELLRQQEEFIKKNRMHIQKRRYDRSPDRSRSRERSYSPSRRDRRASSRERKCISPRGRARRADSKELDNRFPKRRRSSSFEHKRRRDKYEEDEDEETRAYRQEIEKQKAMREKILRDKEMRRRKAAEVKQVEEKLPEEPLSKLKPIIVTESKIISLKKKSNTDSTTQKTTHTTQTQVIEQQKIQRTIPTAKIIPETKRSKIEQQSTQILKDACTTTFTPATTAVVKPVTKKTISVQADINANNDMDEDESLDEELLLADTPSPPPSSPTGIVKSKLSSKKFEIATPKKSSFSNINRRVVLKSSARDQQSITDSNRKPIFDRLERKVGISESVKRKRIVLKNAE